MEILTSRVLLRPTDLGRSLRFYEQTIGLAIYREWGTGPARGVVFFLGGGLLEISGTNLKLRRRRWAWCYRSATSARRTNI